jgi:endonuclease YncB( thermonuclease family)
VYNLTRFAREKYDHFALRAHLQSLDGVGTVRLIGVDTPETVDPRRPVGYFGKEASDFTSQLATGKRVRLEFDQDRTDRYGRTLAYVWSEAGVEVGVLNRGGPVT